MQIAKSVSCPDSFEESDIVFWDFDGVIKETNQLKADAFVNLFKNCSIETRNKIRDYHKYEGVSGERCCFFSNGLIFLIQTKMWVCCNLFSRMVLKVF